MKTIAAIGVAVLALGLALAGRFGAPRAPASARSITLASLSPVRTPPPSPRPFVARPETRTGRPPLGSLRGGIVPNLSVPPVPHPHWHGHLWRGPEFGFPLFGYPYDYFTPYALSPYSTYSPFTYSSPYVPQTGAPNAPIIIQTPPSEGVPVSAALIQQQWTDSGRLQVSWVGDITGVAWVEIALLSGRGKVLGHDRIDRPPFVMVFSAPSQATTVRVTVQYQGSVKSTSEAPLVPKPAR